MLSWLTNLILDENDILLFFIHVLRKVLVKKKQKINFLNLGELKRIYPQKLDIDYLTHHITHT